MKKALYILFFCCGSMAQAQEAPLAHPFELGINLIQYSNNSTPDILYPNQQRVSAISGLFFRYNLDRYSIRSAVNYRNEGSNFTPVNSCIDCGTWSQTSNKIFSTTAGIQFAMQKNRRNFYAFTDLGFRYSVSEGTVTGGFGGFNDQFVNRSAGFMFQPGMGLMLRPWKALRLSGEVFVDGLLSHNAATLTGLTQDIIRWMESNTFSLTPACRLMLSVSF